MPRFPRSRIANWLLTGLLALAGCSRPATRNEVTGTYVMRTEDGEEKIVVNASGTYVHSYPSKNRSMVVDTATWTWEPAGADKTMTFNNFMWRRDGAYGEGTGRGFWPTTPELSFGGRVSIVVNRDLGLKYVKLAHPSAIQLR